MLTSVVQLEGSRLASLPKQQSARTCRPSSTSGSAGPPEALSHISRGWGVKEEQHVTADQPFLARHGCVANGNNVFSSPQRHS